MVTLSEGLPGLAGPLWSRAGMRCLPSLPYISATQARAEDVGVAGACEILRVLIGFGCFLITLSGVFLQTIVDSQTADSVVCILSVLSVQ